jgi:hypothetical protein
LFFLVFSFCFFEGLEFKFVPKSLKKFKNHSKTPQIISKPPQNHLKITRITSKTPLNTSKSLKITQNHLKNTPKYCKMPKHPSITPQNTSKSLKITQNRLKIAVKRLKNPHNPLPPCHCHPPSYTPATPAATATAITFFSLARVAPSAGPANGGAWRFFYYENGGFYYENGVFEGVLLQKWGFLL